MADMRARFSVPEPTNYAETPAQPAEAQPQAAEPEVTEPAVEQQTERTRGADGKFAKTADEVVPEVPVKEPDASTVEEKEEPLPPNVQKRIAKEVAEQARIDREIQTAVLARKAKQAELDKLKADTGTSGSEPATTTAPAKTNDRPVKPQWEGEEKDPGALKFWAAHSEYLEKNETWLIAETRRAAREEAEAEFVKRAHSEKVSAKISEGTKKHGEKFQGMLDTVLATAPENLQVEIGKYEDWPDTVAHFGKNPDELKALGALFDKNPSMAIRELGRLEDRLKKPETNDPPVVAATKALPEPPERVGGNASVVQKIDGEKAPMAVFKRLPVFKR